MDKEKYPIIERWKSKVFDFESEGPAGRIWKRVSYEKFTSPWIYNLGFGDKYNFRHHFNDKVVTNNNDTKKVLATIVETLYRFTTTRRNATVVAYGNTEARNRLYRIYISSIFELIQADFVIMGSKNSIWYPFEKNTAYDGFSAKRKFINSPI